LSSTWTTVDLSGESTTTSTPFPQIIRTPHTTTIAMAKDQKPAARQAPTAWSWTSGKATATRRGPPPGTPGSTAMEAVTWVVAVPLHNKVVSFICELTSTPLAIGTHTSMVLRMLASTLTHLRMPLILFVTPWNASESLLCHHSGQVGSQELVLSRVTLTTLSSV